MKSERMKLLQVAACFCIGGHSLAFGQAIRFFLADPDLPRFTGRRIFTGKGD